MKKNIPLLRHALAYVMLLVILSCNVTPELTESPVASSSVGSANPSTNALGLPVPSVTLDRIKIYTSSSSTLSGTVTVQIADNTGNVILGSSILDGSLLIGTKWTTFYFSPISLTAGKTYRIKVKRSGDFDDNNIDEHIWWGSSERWSDLYPKGKGSISGTYTYDFTFITYSGGYVDQKQTNQATYWGLTRFAMWQEFVPEKIAVINP